jgi:ankyrin repeat protein
MTALHLNELGLAFIVSVTLLSACSSSETTTRKASPFDSFTASNPSPASAANSPKTIRDVDRKLLTAAGFGDLKSVEESLTTGADINVRDETFGRTPLMEAAASGQTDTALKLIEKGADINARDAFYGSTALMFAAGQGATKIVKALLEKGAEVNATNNKGYTALDAAEEEFRKDVIALLKKAGAKNSERQDTASAAEKEDDLRLAARDGNTEKIHGLLAQGVNIDGKDESGWTALREAVFQENVAVVKLLLNNKADPNLRDYQDGSTALHWAARTGNTEIVAALLSSGADPDAHDKTSGSTPLMFAAVGGYVAITKNLLARGADIDAVDEWGEPVFPQAVSAYESARGSGRDKDARALMQIIQVLQRAGAR